MAKAAERVVLITGSEDLLRRRALKEVLGDRPADDFDLEVIVADAAEPTAWIASASTAPFLGDHRTVVVRNLLRQEPGKQAASLSEALARLPETARLILVVDEETGDESRQQRLATVRKGWEKVVKEAKGKTIVCEAPGKDLRAPVRAEAERLGKKMSLPAVDLLVEMTGGSLTRALEEIEKLALYVGDAAEIRRDDVELVVTPSREWNVFKLLDAVLAGQPYEALRQLRLMIAGSRPEEAAQRSVLPVLAKQLRLVWQGRVAIESRASLADPTGSFVELLPSRPNLLDEPSWRQTRVMDLARRITYDQCAECLDAVAHADAALKGLVPSAGTMDTLELMVLRIASVASPRVAGRY